MIACQRASRGPAPAHRERQQRQDRELRRKVPQNLLVAPDVRVVPQVPVHGDVDGRVQEQVAPHLLGRGERQLTLALVHRAVRMKGDDPSPAELVEEPAQLPGRMAQFLVVVVGRELDAGYAASHVDVSDPLTEVPYPGVAFGRRSVDPLRLGALVGLPRDGDLEHREDQALLVAQRDPGARLERLRESPADVERDRDGPELAAGQPQRFHDVLVRLPIHEAVERSEPAVHQQLEVAELPLREGHRRHVERPGLQLLRFGLTHEQRFQRSSNRRCFPVHAHPSSALPVAATRGADAPGTAVFAALAGRPVAGTALSGRFRSAARSLYPISPAPRERPGASSRVPSIHPAPDTPPKRSCPRSRRADAGVRKSREMPPPFCRTSPTGDRFRPRSLKVIPTRRTVSGKAALSRLRRVLLAYLPLYIFLATFHHRTQLVRAPN